MYRHLLAVVVLLVGLLAWGQQAVPEKTESPPARRLPGVQPGEQVAAALKKVISFGGMDDPRTSLSDALDQLAKIHGLTFDVNEKAFAAEEVTDVLKAQIVEDRPIAPMKTTLATVLGKVLARVPTRSGAGYLVRGDRVEITTEAALREEVWGKDHRGPYLPLVHVTANAWELADLLTDLGAQANRNVTLDPRALAKARKPVTAHLLNQPLDSALFLLTDMAELAFVQIDGTFHVTTPERATELKAAWAKLRGRPAEPVHRPGSK